MSRPHPPVEIRALTLAELGAYKSLRLQALLDHPEAFTSDAETERRKPAASYRSRLASGRSGSGHFTLAAWHDGQLAGAISCEREQRLKARHIGHLAGMMVRGDQQGLGIGRALLAAAIAAARLADGLELLTLSVTASNRVAIGLYERAGFTTCGALPRAIKLDGAYHTKNQMVLLL